MDSVSAGGSRDRSLPYDQYLAQYSETVGAINGRCHEAFKKAGYDPAQFNTANSTNDLVGLLAALGYESYNLHGTSYGTRLALETARRHPEAPIRSMVLDSPATTTVDRLSNLAVAPHEMVMRLFANCAADADCSEAYADLPARTAALLAQLDAQPLSAGERRIGPEEVITQTARSERHTRQHPAAHDRRAGSGGYVDLSRPSKSRGRHCTSGRAGWVPTL